MVFAQQDGSPAEQVFGLGFAALILVIVLGACVLFVAALVSIVRSRSYTSSGKALWVLAVFAFPFLGPLVWFVWGRNSSFGGGSVS
ncbi:MULTISPECIES: PLD nuclease N-terminal domain-containing protein [Nocardiaceae]|uniref:PLD nuclease N-terminal domain-containing protein n=1 Tax=Nocardiaceae TaxID=85025 RepID=UPI0009B8CDEA|nr:MULTISPECIES: PLD nuclease N-terminal domain-containing protein [Rhodococcus]OZD12089.1 hypothetical protein CH248_29245 [Rhodococcus sp. 06-156-4a]OZD15758.1 hypothetical protein CH253_22585 [Rhodococcus sp. 06-156-3C]OZD21142.1 hypothetical protein CH280_02815 [Rhodococcus sp. 06-156-4C]OZD32325.1 hypothetical protein CH284_20745 [Rhodococcus sp. 06-156-3]OZD36546.1 hypothetical protein CH247_03170 [Rhodococcus sp. 06-156-3b]